MVAITFGSFVTLAMEGRSDQVHCIVGYSIPHSVLCWHIGHFGKCSRSFHVHLKDTAVQKFGVGEIFFIKKCFKETTFIQGFIKLISKQVGENLQGQQDSFTALIYAGRERERGTKAEESP